MRRTLSALVLGACILAATAACAKPGTSSDPGASSSAASTPGAGTAWPEGREFLSTSVTESGVERPLVPGTKLVVRFGPLGELYIQAGCNQLGVKGHLEGDRLVPDDYLSTAMACASDRMAQDKWVLAFFQAGPTWRLTGDKVLLRTGTAEIHLTDREVVDPDRPLQGTQWTVVSVKTAVSISSVWQDTGHLTFGGDGTFTAETGCATLSGPAVIQGDTIVFGQVTRVELPCDPKFADLDSSMMDTLRGTVTYDIKGPSLSLRNADDHGLFLEASA